MSSSDLLAELEFEFLFVIGLVIFLSPRSMDLNLNSRSSS